MSACMVQNISLLTENTFCLPLRHTFQAKAVPVNDSGKGYYCVVCEPVYNSKLRTFLITCREVSISRPSL
jgi:hypothetical protein